MESKQLTNQTVGESRETPVKAGRTLRVLWQANLRAGTRKDSFLFRSTEDFGEASQLAQDLLDSSPGAEMAGAVIVGLERKARLWN